MNELRTIEKTHETSSTVKRTKFYLDERILEVEFNTGKIYHYEGVDLDTHNSMLETESIGTFFNNRIKWIFTFKLIN